MIASKFDKYCDELDRKLAGKFTEEIYYEVEKVPTKYFTNLFLDECRYRAKYYMNLLASISGQQGRAFKSLFALALGIMLGDIFNQSFKIESILVDPFEVDTALRKVPNRSTILIDEYKHTRVDLMSATTYFSLADYEEQGRFTQKNILLATPKVQKQDHYFIFKEHSHTRITNKQCQKCKKNDKCHWEQIKTLCKIPYWKREGYPKNISFMLYTHRKMDDIIVPRGIVTLPIVHYKTLEEYYKVKLKIIAKLESKTTGGWGILHKEAKKIFNKYHKKLIKKNKKPESVAWMEYYIRKEIGIGKYPRDAIKTIALMLKEMAIEKYK